MGAVAHEAWILGDVEQRMSSSPRKSDPKRFNVYVIGLARDVLNERKFVEANPQFNLRKPCVYVGMTGLTPSVRFLRHRSGIQACRFVRLYGECLKPRLYRRFNPMTYVEAQAMERELARRLRNRGYAVWQK
jgi:hypothetical protein